MTWERFFLLVLVASPIMATNLLLWVVLPASLSYWVAMIVAAVVAWHGRKFYDEAEKEIRIRNGSWVP